MAFWNKPKELDGEHAAKDKSPDPVPTEAEKKQAELLKRAEEKKQQEECLKKQADLLKRVDKHLAKHTTKKDVRKSEETTHEHPSSLNKFLVLQLCQTVLLADESSVDAVLQSLAQEITRQLTSDEGEPIAHNYTLNDGFFTSSDSTTKKLVAETEALGKELVENRNRPLPQTPREEVPPLPKGQVGLENRAFSPTQYV